MSPHPLGPTLALYGHPFSSYTQKALIALYEAGTAFEFRMIGPDTPEHVGEWMRRWPMGSFPLLVDGDQTVTETSIIIEHLQMAHPGPRPLIPIDAAAALEVRFLDRFFDLYVMERVQFAVGAALGRYGAMTAAEGLEMARERLEKAYGWLEGRLAGRAWAEGEDFTLADCAAGPALFYADWTHPIGPGYPTLRAYRERLIRRASFARAIEEARPYRGLFPLGAPDQD